MTTNCLYRCYDVHGHLLYVGITDDPDSRLVAHEQHSHWFPSVYDVNETWLPTRADAELAERKAIGTEHPRHNVLHRTHPSPEGDYSERFGNTIRLIMAEVGMSFHRLHTETGISRTTLTRKLNGDVLNVRDIELIAKAVRYAPEEIALRVPA